MTLLVHSSLSVLGWVSGGPVTVVFVLEHALGAEGTIVMPTPSGDLSDPAKWENRPVTEARWQIIRDAMPAGDPTLNPNGKMGAISEIFRMQCDTLRISYPPVSFAAHERCADQIASMDSLDCRLAEESSPALLRFESLVSPARCHSCQKKPSMHLAEYRANYPGMRIACKLHRSGLTEFTDGSRLMGSIGTIPIWRRSGRHSARETGLRRSGNIAMAKAILLRPRALGDFAVQWMESNRT